MQVLTSSWDGRPFGHNRHGLKIGGCAPFSGEGELGPYLAQCRLGRGQPPCQVPSWSIQPFGHNSHGPKIEGCAPFGGGELGPHLAQRGLGWGLPACQASSPASRLATKTWAEYWGYAPLGRGELVPSNTMWPGPRPACQVSSWSIQPFGHKTPTSPTERQTGQTGQTVAPKWNPFRTRHKTLLKGDRHTIKIGYTQDCYHGIYLFLRIKSRNIRSRIPSMDAKSLSSLCGVLYRRY